MTEPSTPLMRQYAAIKKEHPSALLFFRLGDFYELFFEDAVVAARELQITLTSRNKEKGAAIPMCGVPYHSADNYIAKLIRKGFKVAICEQMEDPRLAKKLVKREVTRVLTPGTAADAHLGSEENNFLACVARAGNAAGFAALDLSTGEFRATEFVGDDAERRIREELLVLRPREVLFASSLPLFDQPRASAPQAAAAPRMASLENATWAETPLDDWVFAPDYAIPQVENHFGVLSLEGFGLAEPLGSGNCGGRNPALCAHHAARLARSRGPHRLLRAAELPGAGRGHGSQSRTDRAALLRRGRQRHVIPFSGSHGDADGQAPAARLDAAPVDRYWRDQPATGRRRRHGERSRRPRRAAPLDGRHSRPGAPAKSRHAGDRQPARSAGAGYIAGEVARGANITVSLPCRAITDTL